MMNTWALSALWLGWALLAMLLAIWFRVSPAPRKRHGDGKLRL